MPVPEMQGLRWLTVAGFVKDFDGFVRCYIIADHAGNDIAL